MSVSQAGREFLVRDTTAPPPNKLMQYGPVGLRFQFPAGNRTLIPGVEGRAINPGRGPGNVHDSSQQCACWRTFTLRAMAFFANLDLGMGQGLSHDRDAAAARSCVPRF